jgi:multidrug efflux pump subunit AcrA (membrane-fusion protein)
VLQAGPARFLTMSESQLIHAIAAADSRERGQVWKLTEHPRKMMPRIGRAVSPILFLLAFVLTFADESFPPAPPAAHAQGLIRNLIARLRGETMPAGIVKANGLTEAAQVDVSSKYPGRLAEISVKEGTKVAIGQAIAQVSSPEVDVTLVSPRDGEVQYLLAGAGETVAAGEPIVTIVDLTDVYVTVYLPAADAGALGIGDEARVILNAAPGHCQSKFYTAS